MKIRGYLKLSPEKAKKMFQFQNDCQLVFNTFLLAGKKSEKIRLINN